MLLTSQQGRKIPKICTKIEKNQSRNFDKLNTTFCLEFDADSKCIEIYVYLWTKAI